MDLQGDSGDDEPLVGAAAVQPEGHGDRLQWRILMAGLDFIFLGLLVLLLLPIVLIDLRESRIPNICNLALAAGGLVQALVA